MKKRVLLFFMACLMISNVIHAQTMNVFGAVISGDDKEPIIGASVLVKGTSLGTITDMYGKFKISNVPLSAKKLIVSFIGMTSQEVNISNSSMTIVLKPDNILLNEVIVTGYGVTRKAAFTGSAQVVNKEVVSQKTDANFLKSLQGSVAGFQIMNASGQPGAFASTTIRGTSSLNSGTEPLYVIDGVPMYTGNLTSSDNSTGINPLTNINSNDIESITVLKDATATSIYGARAANGVIVITTKRGKKGKAQVNLDARFGCTFLGHMNPDYKMVGLDDFKSIWTEGIQNGYAAGNITSSNLAAVNMTGADLSDAANAAEFGRRWGVKYFNSDWDTAQDINWLNEALKSSMVQDYNLSVQGGNDKVSCYASLGYYENGGIVIGSGIKKYSGSLTVDAKSEKLGYGASINISLSDVDQIPINSSYTNPIVLAYDTRPFQQIYNSDGSYAMVKEGDYNLVALYDKKDGITNNLKTLVNIINPYFTYDFNKSLKWKTNAALTMTQANSFVFYGKNYPGSYSNGEYYSFSGTKGHREANTYIITNTLNYQKTFNKAHNLNIMLGQEAQKLTISALTASAQGYPYSDMKELSNASTPTAASSTYEASTLASFFSNFEYNYSDRYYLSGSLRYDGSSRFGANNRWAPFWSIGGKYRITQETFMEKVHDWLSDLTIHASYGTVGNQDIGFYAAKGLYSYGSSYNSNPGAVPSQLENPDLKWETVAKFDLGFSANLWSRINVDIDFYDQRTKDMIFNVPQSLTTGFSYVTKNVGEMQNAGIEAMINASIIRTKDFSWDINYTYTYNKNKILKLATDEPITSTYNIQEVGKAVNTFYLPEWAGVDPETGEGLWYTNGAGSATTTDVNQAKQVCLGQAAPKYYGALGMNFKYKNFDLSFSSNYSGGNKIFNRGLQYDIHCGHYKLGPVSEYVFKNSWKEPGDITNVPKFIWGGNTGCAQRTSRFLLDADYIRLENVTLGYTLPSSVCRNIYLSKLRVYISADNLFTLTKGDFLAFDPQARADGFVHWAYPSATTVLLGVSVGF